MDARILLCIGAATAIACGPKPSVAPATKTPAPVAAAPRLPDPEPATTGEPEPEPSAPTCEAQVADVPTGLFGDRILIRPPVNVELVEDNPTFATTYSSFVSACDATVDRMSLLVFADEPNKSLQTYLAEFRASLAQSGYQGGEETPVAAEKNQVMSAVEFPAADGNPPAKVLISVARKPGNVIVVFYQTQPDQWDGLSNTFVASANTLLVTPP